MSRNELLIMPLKQEHLQICQFLVEFVKFVKMTIQITDSFQISDSARQSYTMAGATKNFQPATKMRTV